MLGAETDAQLGLFSTRPSPSDKEPFEVDEPSSGPVEELGVPATVGLAAPPSGLPPGSSPRPVLHWTGRKAYALRIAMRMTIREFAAKLGVSHSVVGRWQPTEAGSLRPETHQMLDTMLSIATGDR